MDTSVVWQGIRANVVGAIIGGMVAIASALWVVRLTNQGAVVNARQERLEAAQAEMIQAVAAMYDPQLSLSAKRDRDVRAEWAPRFAQARVRVLLLTGSDDLDDSLRSVVVEWESQWRRLRDYLRGYTGPYGAEMELPEPGKSRLPTPEGVGRALEHVEGMPGDLQRRLRDLNEPSAAAAEVLRKSLGEWHDALERRMDEWPESRKRNHYG